MVSDKQVVYAKCPFCDKGTIEIIVFPAGKTVRYARGSGKPGHGFKSWSQESIVTTKECPVCGKSNKDIAKKLKKIESGEMESKPKSKEEIRKQLEELGLLDRFGGKE